MRETNTKQEDLAFEFFCGWTLIGKRWGVVFCKVSILRMQYKGVCSTHIPRGTTYGRNLLLVHAALCLKKYKYYRFTHIQRVNTGVHKKRYTRTYSNLTEMHSFKVRKFGRVGLGKTLDKGMLQDALG